jgi:eukaryotic-like serine/threonine-protein kinase
MRLKLPPLPRSPSAGLSVPTPLVQTTFAEGNADIAPRGQWLAYESNESGRQEVYVRPFPNVDGARRQVSTAGGRTPLWSRDGQELFYLSPEGAVMGVRVDIEPAWRSSTPKRIVQGPYYFALPGFGRYFDISLDGRRFLIIKQGSDANAASPQIIVVQHWTEELQRLVPTK